MNLNESFRYCNYITSLMDQLRLLLSREDFIRKTSIVHRMSGVVPNCDDKVEEAERPNDIPNITPDQAIDFLIALFQEKQNVDYAIDHAKVINMDADISLNKVRRSIGVLLSNLGNAAQTVKKKNCAYAHGLNKDGGQEDYQYVTELTLSVDYNRAAAKAYGKQLIKEAEEISTRLDGQRILYTVNFHPTYDVTDTLEEAFEKYVETTKPVEESPEE